MSIFDKLENPSEQECKDFLNKLWDSNYRFHLDDRAEDIINSKSGTRLFTNKQAEVINHNVTVCFATLEDPWDIYYKSNEFEGAY